MNDYIIKLLYFYIIDASINSNVTIADKTLITKPNNTIHEIK